LSAGLDACPASGSNRVKRGGSWNNNAQNCRSANRNNNNPNNMNNNIGLRLSSTARCEWPRFTDRGRVCGLSRSPSGSAVPSQGVSGHAAGCPLRGHGGQRQTGGPRLVVVARDVAVSVGAALFEDLDLCSQGHGAPVRR
jgi:hypothetical protein